MLRRLGLMLLPLALVLTACGGGGDKTAPPETKATSVPPTAVVQPTATAQPTTAPESNAGAPTGNPFLSAFNPLQVLGAAESAPSGASGQADPSLEAALLTADDLPAGFLSLGQFNYTVPSELGSMKMAASMFMNGDMASGGFDSMVMSMAAAMPPEALQQFRNSPPPTLTDADIAAMNKAAAASGVQFKDLRMLDASGLGDEGYGMHMAMDFGSLAAQAAPQGQLPFGSALAADIYMFLRGDHMLMVMVMWPDGKAPSADGRSLAEVMDGKAAVPGA